MTILYKLAYWAGVIAQVVIRYPYQQTAKVGEKTGQRVSRTENILLVLLTLVALVLPLVYSLTHLLDFANYHLPVWLGVCGLVLLVLSLFVFWRAHFDLKANWSPSLEIRLDHTLVTDGIYRLVRHPMYLSQLLWALAQILLIQNWLAGPLNLFFFIPFYFLRSRAEEKMMLDRFGDQYRLCMQNTGGIFPFGHWVESKGK
jgi:protein-S-isoprenylcysteine O-methyltransferase Ste14